MSFEITHEILDQIIFGMENQEQYFVLDLQTGQVVLESSVVEGDDDSGDQPTDSEVDGERYVDLPEWNSTLGYQLMERFVATLRNPVIREDLRDSLAAGRGVFRRFKNTLRSRPEIERLWYRFKEREMRNYVLEWFETVMTARGLQTMNLDIEQPETFELVRSDFVVERGAGPSEGVLRELDKKAFLEMYRELPVVLAEHLWQTQRTGCTIEPDDVVAARAPKGELAGFLWATPLHLKADNGTDLLVSKILQIYVVAEYRGLGLSKALVDRHLEDAYEYGVDVVVVGLGGTAYGMGEWLARTGFAPLSSTYQLDMRSWGRENLYS